MRTCRECGCSDNTVEFYSLRDICKPCRSKYMKDWYERNSTAHKQRVKTDTKRRKQERRQLVNELKSVPCADCGVQYPPYVMDFDHRGDKEFEIADAMRCHVGNKRFLREIAKCDVVCSNCHRERTHGSQV